MKHFDVPTRRGLLQGAAALAGLGLAGLGLAGLPGSAALAKAPMLNEPTPGYHRFKLGAFEVTVVSDGPLAMGPPSGNIFTGLSKEDMTQALASHYQPTESVELEQNTVVVNTGTQVVLFDTGTGPAVKMFGPYSGRLLANLKAAGIDPVAVDVVALTHAHADHCFGLTTGKAERNFPNAKVAMMQAEFDFWTDEAKATNDMMRMMVGGARQNLLPYRDRMTFIKDGQEVVPGIQAIATPGHTVGHTSFMITSQGQSLLNAGDLCHHHIVSLEKPRLPFAYDTDGEQGVASRLRTFDMLASSRIPMVAYHFPWPGVGHVGKAGDAYRYFPSPMRTVL